MQFRRNSGTVLLVIAFVACAVCADADGESRYFIELCELFADDAGAGDDFGVSVALDGNTALVGAYGDDYSGGPHAGSAFVFVRTDGVWTQEAKLTIADPEAYDRFGRSVALCGDTALVGADGIDLAAGEDAGAAYVFVRANGAWTQQAMLTSPDAAEGDLFGTSVALDGDTALIGAYKDDHEAGEDAGSAYVFVRADGIWSEQAKLTAAEAEPYDHFSWPLALYNDTALIGAPSADPGGAAYVFVRTSGVWIQQARLIGLDPEATDGFGGSVALDADTVLIAAARDDHEAGDDAGSVYVFVRADGQWSQQARLVAADAEEDGLFGASAALDGDTALIGACGDAQGVGLCEGSVYAFLRVGDEWVQRAELTASDPAAGDMFGNSVAVEDGTALIGAWGDDDAGVNAGSAYVFVEYPLGDLNCDGGVDYYDIDAFIMALVFPEEYAVAYPDCGLMLADCNRDGFLDFFDLDPFVQLLPDR